MHVEFIRLITGIQCGFPCFLRKILKMAYLTRSDPRNKGKTIFFAQRTKNHLGGLGTGGSTRGPAVYQPGHITAFT